MEKLVFLSGKRTAFGANGGKLKALNPTDLCIAAGKSVLEQAGIKSEQIDHVILGNVLHSAPDSIYTPRHTALKLGIPVPVPALGINRLCGSGFQVVVEAYQQMLSGETQLALVGGVENMSMTPYVLRGARLGYRMGNQVASDMLMESLTDSYAGAPMAITAENLATQYGLSREEVDAYALQSQLKAKMAQDKKLFNEEIAPCGDFTQDEHPRPETTLESLAKLKPVFKKDGVVTAGNASGIVDGAAMMVVTKESYAQSKGLHPIGRLIGYGVVGCDPKIMGIGPVPAIKKVLALTGMSLTQMDLIEINEAFAAQTLSVARELKLPMDRLNVNGGAIAIGHPLAASGTRILMHLLYELRRRKLKYGLGSACIGGGQGIAMIVEAI